MELTPQFLFGKFLWIFWIFDVLILHNDVALKLCRVMIKIVTPMISHSPVQISFLKHSKPLVLMRIIFVQTRFVKNEIIIPRYFTLYVSSACILIQLCSTSSCCRCSNKSERLSEETEYEFLGWDTSG